jgi:hypothetical protein
MALLALGGAVAAVLVVLLAFAAWAAFRGPDEEE